VSSVTKDLNGHYVDSEAAASGHSLEEGVIGIHLVNTSSYNISWQLRPGDGGSDQCEICQTRCD
jgi:hypothetical protein